MQGLRLELGARLDELTLLPPDLALDEHDVGGEAVDLLLARRQVRAEDLVEDADLRPIRDGGFDVGDEPRSVDGLDDDAVERALRQGILELGELRLRHVVGVEHLDRGVETLGGGRGGSEHGRVVAVGHGERHEGYAGALATSLNHSRCP